MRNPFCYYKTSPDVIRLAVMMYIRFPLSSRQVEDLLHERGIDISYETVCLVRYWGNRMKRKAAVILSFSQANYRLFADQTAVRATPLISNRTGH